jgi:hypothetical protein
LLHDSRSHDALIYRFFCGLDRIKADDRYLAIRDAALPNRFRCAERHQVVGSKDAIDLLARSQNGLNSCPSQPRIPIARSFNDAELLLHRLDALQETLSPRCCGLDSV